jgi:Ca-activated chloride channel family protein
MSQPDEPKRDDLEDRLMDQALREVLGGQSPPDLSARILAAAEKQIQVSPQPKERVMDRPKRSYRVWFAAAAVCLLVGGGVALTVALTGGRRVAYERTPEDLDQLASRADRRIEDPSAAVAPYSLLEDTTRLQSRPDGLDHDKEYADFKPLAQPIPAPSAAPGGNRQGERLEREVFDPLAAPPGLELPADMPVKLGTGPAPPPGTPKPEVQPPMILSGAETRVHLDAWKVGNPKPESEFDYSSSGLWAGTTPDGKGPGRGGDKYDRLVENPFRLVEDHPLSTFSIDVDTASYANVRRFLLQEGRLPPPDAVRIEELVNYFDYDYAGPEDDVPFASHIEVAACPWAEGHRLVRVGLKGKEIENEDRPESNLVFLLDVSGSMNSPDKLPLLREGMKLLAMQMRQNDRVAIVVYAGSEGLALPSTPGSDRQRIVGVLDRLQSGGSTAGGAGIELAYRVARESFIEGGVNRVILCTDGDFNVGTTSTAALERMVEEKAKSGVFLSVLGFGRGNLNDAMMETISNKGNGNYSYIDGITEAYKVLVQQLGGTLVTIAKDVKIQIEFNPAQVAAYRLIGYENRMLAKEDFNDDKKDAGEIGAGHTVTALYELVPAGVEVDVPSVDPLKYQPPARTDGESSNDELLTLKLRYKQPDGDTSRLLEFPVTDGGRRFGEASGDMQFAAAVASFGMLLRGSEHAGTATCDAVLEIASSAQGPDVNGYRAEFLDIVRRAKLLSGR